jgi:signal transduction histidine kinase
VNRSDGTSLGVAVTLRDVTERKRMEETRLQALRLESMGLMAGGIAHDFNNLLAVIVGNIEIAKLAVLDAETAEGLDEARAAAQRASELVQQLLAFAAQHEPILTSVDLSALTGEIVRYARRIPGKDVTFRQDLAAGLPTIDADATQLRQLVLNLLVNAIDAAGETKGEITVTTRVVTDPRTATRDLVIMERPAPAYLWLQVSDNGSGMSQETRARIFEPFYSTKPRGHGLGLATVLGAVRSHGGTLSVESAPGEGARFNIFLPTA